MDFIRFRQLVIWKEKAARISTVRNGNARAADYAEERSRERRREELDQET
jgi:hypothetical protein